MSGDGPTDDERGVRDAELATVHGSAHQPGLVRRLLGGLVADPRVRGTTYLLLDLSASMGDEGKMPQLRIGALRFFAEAWKLGYAVGAVGFSRRAAVLQPATRDFHRFQRCLDGIAADGRTAMAAAIRLGTRRLRGARGDRALLLITDGMPNSREATLAAAREARAQGITLIAVGTDRADEVFLAALTGRPELACRVEAERFGAGVGDAAGRLPRSRSGPKAT